MQFCKTEAAGVKRTPTWIASNNIWQGYLATQSISPMDMSGPVNVEIAQALINVRAED